MWSPFLLILARILTTYPDATLIWLQIKSSNLYFSYSFCCHCSFTMETERMFMSHDGMAMELCEFAFQPSHACSTMPT